MPKIRNFKESPFIDRDSPCSSKAVFTTVPTAANIDSVGGPKVELQTLQEMIENGEIQL